MYKRAKVLALIIPPDTHNTYIVSMAMSDKLFDIFSFVIDLSSYDAPQIRQLKMLYRICNIKPVYETGKKSVSRKMTVKQA